MQASMSKQAPVRPEPAKSVPDASGAIATAMNILECWKLSREQQCAVLGIRERSWYSWKQNPPARVSGDALERVSYILGIWKALRQLFPSRESHVRWPHLENRAPLFGGRPPIERMTTGHVGDLYAIREWLDGWRGW